LCAVQSKSMSVRCKIHGHDLTGTGDRVEGKCQIVRYCSRCKTPVVQVAHQVETFVLDPSMPCRITRKCTNPWCGKVISTTDRHHWSYWEAVAGSKTEFTRYCHNIGCNVAPERKHEHDWEVTGQTVSYDIDWDQETSQGVRYDERHCKTCPETDRVAV
jgi:hypothetical protein